MMHLFLKILKRKVVVRNQVRLLTLCVQLVREGLRNHMDYDSYARLLSLVRMEILKGMIKDLDRMEHYEDAHLAQELLVKYRNRVNDTIK
jgi:hypothetical protein